MHEPSEIDINDPQNKPKNVNIHERVTQFPISADEMDSRRLYQKEYDYLCYMAQARDWISRLTDTPMNNNIEFKNCIRKGEIFVKLASVLTQTRIRIYENEDLVYRHTDNHNLFLRALRKLNMRECYLYVTIDAYNATNVPSVIYCIHALSNLCEKLGFDLRIEKDKTYHFSETELTSVKKDIDQFSQLDFESIGHEEVTESSYMKDPENMKKILTDMIGLKLRDIKYKIDINNVKGTVKAKLVKMGSNVASPVQNYLTNKAKEKIQSVYGEEYSDNLKKIFRSFLRRNSMKEIFLGNASIYSIKEVLKRQPVGLKTLLDCKHGQIATIMEENTAIETEIDDILASIDYILENKRINMGMAIETIPFENNKRFKEIFHTIRSDPRLLLDILSKIEKHELFEFIPTYIVPLLSVSSQRDQFLALRIIDEDFSEFGASLYTDSVDENEMYSLSFKIISDLFKVSDDAKKICLDLLVDESVKISSSQIEYAQSLAHIREIVEDTIDKIENIQFPHYVLHFFSSRNDKSDLMYFYKEFVSPFMTSPDAFFDPPQFEIRRDTWLTIDKVFSGIITGYFEEDYFRPLIPWSQEIFKRFSDIFEEMKSNSSIPVQHGDSRVNRPTLRFDYKVLNLFLSKIKIFTTCSPTFNALLKEVEFYSFINNQPVKFHLNPIIDKSTSSQIEDLIDVIRVSTGKDLPSILNRRSTLDEELNYKKLLNYRNIIRQRFSSEADEPDEDLNISFLINDDFESTTETSTVCDSKTRIDINDRINHLDRLKEKLKKIEIDSEILAKICHRVEESQKLVSQKRNEMRLLVKTIQNLKKKKAYLHIKKKSYKEYYNSLLDTYFKQKQGNCSRKSFYGTFKYSEKYLIKNMILFTQTTSQSANFYISCDNAGKLNISVYDSRNILLNSFNLNFDHLLKMKEQKTITCGSYEYNPKGLIRIVNECYLQ